MKNSFCDFEYKGIRIYSKTLLPDIIDRTTVFSAVEEGIKGDVMIYRVFPFAWRGFDEPERRVSIQGHEFYFTLVFYGDLLESIRFTPFVPEYDLEPHYPGESYLLRKFEICERALRGEFGEPLRLLLEDEEGNFVRKIMYDMDSAEIEACFSCSDRVEIKSGGILVRFHHKEAP